MMRVRMFVWTMCAMMIPVVAEAQMVIVVRHAERADGGTSMAPATDPELSDVGKARAQKLAAMLGDAVSWPFTQRSTGEPKTPPRLWATRPV
jgi:hypothetical protein